MSLCIAVDAANHDNLYLWLTFHTHQSQDPLPNQFAAFRMVGFKVHHTSTIYTVTRNLSQNEEIVLEEVSEFSLY